MFFSMRSRTKNIPHYHAAVEITILGVNVVSVSTKCIICLYDFNSLEFLNTHFLFIDLFILWNHCYFLKLPKKFWSMSITN